MANNFYVHIVESPSPDELLNGITEGRALCEFLDIARIPYSYNLAVDFSHFHIAMTDRVVEAIDECHKYPILHLSAHGSEQGIQLTDQSPLSWSKLADHIRDIHEYINGELGVCMSCCGGAYGTQMAEVIKQENIPYQWIIGSFSKIYIQDAALAYAVFYRRHHLGDDDISRLVRAMCAASGITDFGIWDGELIQKAYKQERIAEILGKGHI